MLLMTDVSKTYPSGSVALRDVNIHIQPGEFVFVVGPSGAGKSTFIKMLFREVIPTTGNIYVNGVDLLELKEKEIPYLRRQLGIIFQDYRLLPDRTVYDNVAFAMQVIETPYRKIKRRVMSVLDLVGLRKRANSYPTELSGGEQQRVAIARAIVNDPLLEIPGFRTDLQERLDGPSHRWRQGRLGLRPERQIGPGSHAFLPELHDRIVPSHRSQHRRTGW